MTDLKLSRRRRAIVLTAVVIVLAAAPPGSFAQKTAEPAGQSPNPAQSHCKNPTACRMFEGAIRKQLLDQLQPASQGNDVKPTSVPGHTPGAGKSPEKPYNPY